MGGHLLELSEDARCCGQHLQPPQSAERGVVGPGLPRSGRTQGLEELLVEGGIGLCGR